MDLCGVWCSEEDIKGIGIPILDQLVSCGGVLFTAYVHTQLVDSSRSVQRAIQNKFSDSSKQEAINKLLSSYAYLGELGRQTRSLLSAEDAFSKFV